MLLVVGRDTHAGGMLQREFDGLVERNRLGQQGSGREDALPARVYKRARCSMMGLSLYGSPRCCLHSRGTGFHSSWKDSTDNRMREK